MLIQVKRNLNIRRRPDTAADRVGVVLAGKQIEVTKTVVGEEIDGNALWYVDDGNNYYWSGGVESALTPGVVPAPVAVSVTSPALAIPSLDHIFFDYGDMILRGNPSFGNIVQPDTERQKITVAVFDSGIYEDHPDFKAAFDPQKASQNYSTSATAKDVHGHGTHVAGLIGARSDDTPGIIGTAPKCKLWNIKVIDDNGNANGTSLLNGLRSITPGNVDVVNLSLDVTFGEYKEVEAELERVSKFAVIVAAAGNNGSLLEKYLLFPAMASFIISVGAIDEPFFKANRRPTFNKRLDFILPEWSLMSCSTKEKGFYREDLGSSMATALVSGMIASIIKTQGGDHTTIRSLLNTIAKPYTSVTDLSMLTLIKPS